MTKINFNIYFFLEILHFKESRNLNCNPATRIVPDMGLVVKYLMMLVFILDYFQEKLIIKYDFSWEKGLSQLLNITIVYDPVKNQK